MPPKNKISKDDIVEAAFQIAREEGLAGITARSVAKRLGCSVAPIYVNFAAINDLTEAVLKRVFAVAGELLARQKGPDMFANIGKASITFAREYPVLLRELLMQPHPHMDAYETLESSMLALLAGDEATRGWTPEERKKLLLQMRIFQTGLTVLIANGHVPSWLDDQAAAALLMETGEDLRRSQNQKRAAQKNE